MNRELLSNIYGCFEHLNFIQLPKLVKQRVVASPQGEGIQWGRFIALLQVLANCESMYYRHAYLTLKNNNLTDQYIQVSNDLRNLLKVQSPPNNSNQGTNTSNNNNSGTYYNNNNNQQQQQQQQTRKSPQMMSDDDPEFSFFSSLVLQTCIIVQVRVDMIGVYTTLVLSINQEVSWDQVLHSLELIPTIYRDKITHPLLLGMKTNTNYEISILKNLLKVYLLLSKHVFKDTVLLLYQARIDLDSWKDFDQQSMSKQYDSKWSANSIHQWLSIFHNSLLSKSSLYFYFPFKQVEEENGGTFQSFKDVTLRNNPDYISMIESFYQRTNANFFGIFFECKGKPYSKIGYCFGNDDPPTGLSAYPPIFHLPHDKSPKQHLPNIISIVLENSLDKDIFYYVDRQKTNLEKQLMGGSGGSQPHYSSSSIYHVPKKDTSQPQKQHQSSTSGSSSNLNAQSSQPIELYDHSYFFIRIDAQLFISVVYREVKKQKDPIINDFLKQLVIYLRNTDTLNLLKAQTTK